jgi:hypothetical protein
MVRANTFGQIAMSVEKLSQTENKFQEQVDLANTVMKNVNISDGLIKEIVFYVLST